MSLALYYQMIGRGIRPHPDKETALIVDLCDNFGKFGRVEDLEVIEPRPHCWVVMSGNTQLTNSYFDERGRPMAPERRESAPAVPATPTCPQCGAKMVIRTTYKYGDPREFWGCSRYPQCTGTRPMMAQQRTA
jgi:superfamily II DNA or RNA helicase